MKKSVLMMVPVVFLASSVQAAIFDTDNTKFYVAAEGGYAWVDNSSGGVGGDEYYPWLNTGSDSDSGASVGVKVGMQMGERFRFDLGYTYYGESEATTESQTIYDFFGNELGRFTWQSEAEIHTVMLSAYYDYAQFKKASFYIGAGLGASFIDFDALEYDLDGNESFVSSSDSDTLFAWQLETGVEYSVSECLLLYGGYRYVNLGEVDSSITDIYMGPEYGTLKADLDLHEIFIGLRYSF